jgi:hypothetical protein
MKLRTMILITATLFMAVTANALTPQGRVTRFQELLTQRLTGEGWMLTNQTSMLLTFEKRGSVTDNFLMALAFNGSGASDAVYRLTVTMTPNTEHKTGPAWAYLTLNQSNVFGRPTSVTIKNKRVTNWWAGISESVRSQMPK